MTKVFQKSMSGGIKKYLQILFDELAVYGDEQRKICYKKIPVRSDRDFQLFAVFKNYLILISRLNTASSFFGRVIIRIPSL